MKITCPDCKGTGLQMPLCDGTCTTCNGKAEIERVAPPPTHPVMPDTTDGRLVQELLDREDLTDWESGFCVSVERQVADGRVLSEKQRNKIEQILNKG